MTRHWYTPESAALAGLSWYSAVVLVVVVESIWRSSRKRTKVCVRSCVSLRLTLTRQRKVTGVPVSTVLLGSASRPTSLMVYPAAAEHSEKDVRRSGAEVWPVSLVRL